MHTIRVVVWISSLLIPVQLWTQQAAPSAQSQRDPVAVQLLNQAFTLMGGERFAQIKDLRIDGTISGPDGTDVGTFLAKARGADWSLETVRGSDTTSFRVLNDKGTALINGSRKTLQSSITAGLPLDIVPLLGRWTDFRNAQSRVRVVGSELVDGAQCTQLHVLSPLSSPDLGKSNRHGEVDVFLNPISGVVSAVRYEAKLGMPSPRSVKVETRFADYKQFDGIVLPTQMARYVGGRLILFFHVKTVQLNQGFSDADFQN
jgi:hypothetical protein